MLNRVTVFNVIAIAGISKVVIVNVASSCLETHNVNYSHYRCCRGQAKVVIDPQSHQQQFPRLFDDNKTESKRLDINHAHYTFPAVCHLRNNQKCVGDIWEIIAHFAIRKSRTIQSSNLTVRIFLNDHLML